MKDFIICALVSLIPVVYVTGNVHGYEELSTEIERGSISCTTLPESSERVSSVARSRVRIGDSPARGARTPSL